ncbi:MAG: asparagine synthase C-terminal domain-containing protein [Bacteroidales bacterium]
MTKHKLRKIFEDHVKKNVKEDKVAVLLSSGLDGLVSGLAAHDLGKKVHAFTFRMGTEDSFDSKHARIVANKLGWEFTVVEVPTEIDKIKKAWKTLHAHYQCVKKRDYECAYPMVYCYKAIAEAGYKYVLSGLVADAYFCFARNTHIARISGPHSTLEKFDSYRAEYWAPWFKSGVKGLGVDGYNPSGMLQHELLCEAFDLIHVNPWLDKKTYSYFMGRTWQELNQPRQKRDVVEAWNNHISVVGHRNHRGYQTEAKIPLYFEKLLEDKEINFGQRKRVMDMARDWSKLERN